MWQNSGTNRTSPNMNYLTNVKSEPSGKLLCEDTKNPLVATTGNFGENPFTGSETMAIADQLHIPLARSETCTRPGPGGARLTYIEGWKVIQQANLIFGFNGWSSKVLSIDLRYLEETAAKRYNCCVCATVRITLRDGAMREDRGGGVCEGMRSKGDALLKAEKEAVTDATKRALKNFGLRLGLSLYDRQHVREMNRNPVPPPKSAYAASPVTPAGPRRPISAHMNPRSNHGSGIGAPRPAPPHHAAKLPDSERPRAGASNSRQLSHSHQPVPSRSLHANQQANSVQQRPMVSGPQFTHSRTIQPQANHGQSKTSVGVHQHTASPAFVQQHNVVPGPQNLGHHLHQRSNQTAVAPPPSSRAHTHDVNQISSGHRPVFSGYQVANHTNRAQPVVSVAAGYTSNAQRSIEMPSMPQPNRQVHASVKRSNSDLISPATQQRRARAAIVEKEIAELNSMGLQNFEQ